MFVDDAVVVIVINVDAYVLFTVVIMICDIVFDIVLFVVVVGSGYGL